MRPRCCAPQLRDCVDPASENNTRYLATLIDALRVLGKLPAALEVMHRCRKGTVGVSEGRDGGHAAFSLALPSPGAPATSQAIQQRLTRELNDVIRVVIEENIRTAPAAPYVMAAARADCHALFPHEALPFPIPCCLGIYAAPAASCS
jgi:hypothetical protein